MCRYLADVFKRIDLTAEKRKILEIMTVIQTEQYRCAYAESSVRQTENCFYIIVGQTLRYAYRAEGVL